MAVEIRLPNITGTTEKEQLLQLKSYLYQLSEQLQWAFDNITVSGTTNNAGYVVMHAPGSLAATTAPNAGPQATFSSIKSLIIKSAEIVDAYYQEINKRLEGIYVAQSDFGDYVEKTSLEIEANSKSITQYYDNVQVIIKQTEDEIDGKLTTIGQDLSYAQKDVIVLKGNVEDINSNITSVEADIGELDITIQNTKNELSGNIENAKTDLGSTIEDAYGSLHNSISNTEQNAKDYAEAAKDEAIGYTDGAKSEIEGKINETANDLDGKISDTNGRIDKTNTEVNGLGEGLAAANTRIGEAEGAIEQARTDLTGQIKTVSDSLSTTYKLLASAKNQLQGSLDDLAFDLTGLREIVLGVTAYIKSGQLYENDAGVPVFGIEIGQSVEANGTEAYRKFARFTSEKLSFYDANDNEVAYISDKKLYIRQAEITISLKVGGLVDLVMANGDVVTKWEGVSG